MNESSSSLSILIKRKKKEISDTDVDSYSLNTFFSLWTCSDEVKVEEIIGLFSSSLTDIISTLFCFCPTDGTAIENQYRSGVFVYAGNGWVFTTDFELTVVCWIVTICA
ncbi:hypothetical protein TNCT_215451 [Trichonephila clavata]|uniref:Uncharacterized protein n=1 Tax=Trichonephila clavata TaxID=2740835 RepID=A0A8X6FYJ5_TRICU|nr:hypothetical protein TNCT_215451 [Trichonephila clavata]